MNETKPAASFFRLVSVRAHPGCLYGLMQPTVVGSIKFDAKFPTEDRNFDRNLARLIGSCFPDLKVLPERTLHGPLKPAATRRLQFVQNLADVAVAIQLLADFPVTRGLTLRTNQADIVHIAIPYYNAYSGEDAVRRAAEFVVRAVSVVLDENGTDKDAHAMLPGLIEDFRKAHEVYAPAPGTVPFIRIAEARNMPWRELVGGIIQLGQGASSNRFFATFTDQTSNISARIARQKYLTSTLLRNSGFPVPPQMLVRDEAGAIKAAEQLGYPVVVKPIGEDGGVGVFAGLKTEGALKSAYKKAHGVSENVLVERHIEGDDHRLLVVRGRTVSAVRRMPGAVTGDGQHSVRELVDIANQDPRRGETKTKLVKLSLDEEALELLADAGYGPDTVLEKGEVFVLRSRANLSTGGTPESASDIIHPDNRRLAERAARVVGLDIAGVDYLTTDISKSWKEVGGAICEVNGQPVLRPHWFADPGAKVNDLIIDHLIPKGNGRVPTAAVTGTNGKSTSCQMLHSIICQMGVTSGVSATQGVWIGSDNVSDRDLTGHPGGHLLLTDKNVQSAIVEMPGHSLLLHGFPFDHCTVAGITNIQDDHIGEFGIETKEAMARLKASVFERSLGAIVVNADDHLILQMSQNFSNKRQVLISASENNNVVLSHLSRGGVAVVLKSHEGHSTICKAHQSTVDPIVRLADIPATDNGNLAANVQNALFATGLALGLDVPLPAIAKGLKAFDNNNLDCNLGRFSWINGFPYRVMLDYANNIDAISQLCSYIATLKLHGRKRILLRSFGGNQKHFLNLGVPILSNCFDEFIISLDERRLNRDGSFAGMAAPEICEHLAGELQQAGVKKSDIRIEKDANTALQYGLSKCKSGDLLVVNSGYPKSILAQIEQARTASQTREYASQNG